MSLNSETRKLIRGIIKQVHPDLFPSNPYEKQSNSDSLKALNVYIDQVSQGKVPRPARLEFYIKEATKLRKVEATLNASGNLAPLFFAFGLISHEQLVVDEKSNGLQDTNFLGWLREQVQEAVRTAEQHDLFKWHIRRLRSNLENKYKLTAVQVGAEYAASLSEQERQVEALKVLESALMNLHDQGMSFDGISINLYHPKLCPMESSSYVDEGGNFNMRMRHMRAHVADDGALHIVAERATIQEELRGLDLDRARTLTRVSNFWVRRVKELTPAITDLLGVRSVWCDTKTEQNSQKFVLWAGYLLEHRPAIQSALQGKKFSFPIIVHTDPQSPMINFHQSSPILNVRADCPPTHLLEFLVSEAGGLANEAANQVQANRQKEEALLERVRQAFDAKCVIKICMNEKVVEGAQRLLDNAHIIRQAVDLRGACIALDDCYEVWDSGFISIPYNFQIQELPAMVRMLQAGQRPQAAGAAAAAAASGAPAASGMGGGEDLASNRANTGSSADGKRVPVARYQSQHVSSQATKLLVVRPVHNPMGTSMRTRGIQRRSLPVRAVHTSHLYHTRGVNIAQACPL